MDGETIFNWTCGIICIILISVILIWFILSLFFTYDIGPYMQTSGTDGVSVYKVRMERKFGEDRILYCTTDKAESHAYYFKLLEK